MARKRFADHESFRRIAAEIRADTERRMAATPRPGRSTVPYAEPGPTTHENVTLLEREAESAYLLLERVGSLVSLYETTLPHRLTAEIRAHLKTYEERYRKQGGGR